jgi:hypothetical protein
MTPIADYVGIAKRLATGDNQGLVNTLVALPDAPELIADRLRAHHLVGLVGRAVGDAGGQDPLPHELLAALASRQPEQRLSVAALLDAFDEVRRELALVGVPALLLKGLLFAERLYGGIDRRPQYDVDVLVRARHFDRALRALERCGFARQTYDLHSRTLVRGDLKLDLHRFLRWAPAYRLDEQSLWAEARDVRIADRTVPTLSDDHTLVMLTLATFEDLGQGMAKLKQLLDLFLFLRELEGSMDWQSFLAQRERENLRAVSVNVLALVLDVFEAHQTLPRLAAALKAQPEQPRHGSRDEVLALLAAPRKAAANLAWFARVYPGVFAHYLAWFWAGGFPANLRNLGRAWVVQGLKLALAPRRCRGTRST